MKNSIPKSTLFLLLLVAVLAAAAFGISLRRDLSRPEPAAEAAAPLPPETQAPDTAPVSTASLTDPEALAGNIVAEAGGAVMTNAELQIRFMDAVRSWMASGEEPVPELSRPLAEQSCPVSEEAMSWQDFFIRRAVSRWRLEQAAIYAAAQPQSVTDDEDYRPIEYLHTEFVTEELPVNEFLYGPKDCYTPNSVHQSWLDSLDDTLTRLAADLGFANADAYAAAVYGAGVTGSDVLLAAKNANLAYMYFTEKSYYAEPTDSEIAALLRSEPELFPQGRHEAADIRHVLLIPEDASVDDSGRVTAGQEAWAACVEQAEKLLEDLKRDPLTAENGDAAFARLANQHSRDAGSAMDGGLYLGIGRGELIRELDNWVFAPGRLAGDSCVLRTELGVHIIYLKGVRSAYSESARQILLQRRMEQTVQQWLEDMPFRADWDAAAVWCSPGIESIDLQSLLYPDIGHQRFPEPITFLQQDYYYSPYGSSTVGVGGCGITTFAMLATYMTDKVYTPAQLAVRYADYHTPDGTDGNIFVNVPAELGFYLDHVEHNLDGCIEALKSGHIVISLQHLGYFTRGGHYLLLLRWNEEDETFQIRDSNAYNYARLSGHKTNRFTRANLLSGMAMNYVLQEKIVRIPSCSRCGITFDEGTPELLLNTEYTCEKCLTALARRNTWLVLTGSTR